MRKAAICLLVVCFGLSATLAMGGKAPKPETSAPQEETYQIEEVSPQEEMQDVQGQEESVQEEEDAEGGDYYYEDTETIEDAPPEYEPEE